MSTSKTPTTPPNKPQQSLAVRDKKDLERIESVEALSVHFDSNKHIVLAPKTVLSGGLPEGMSLSIREVRTDIEDTYWMPAKNGKNMRGLPKTTLMQIADAVGLDWKPPVRTDDRSHPHYCEWTATAVKRDLDGSHTTYSDTKCIDLRESAVPGIPGKDFEEMIDAAKAQSKRAQANGKKPRDPMDQIRQARKFISEICLAKAMNRVVADATGIKRAYPEKDLQSKTFVVAKLVPDTRDPEGRRAVLAAAMGATEAMFGQPQPKEQQKVVDAVFDDSSEQGQAEQPPNDEQPQPPQQQEDEQPNTGTPEVISAVKEAWVNARNGGMPAKTFQEISSKQTGKDKKEQMTIEDVEKVQAAIEAWFEQQETNDDEVPF